MKLCACTGNAVAQRLLKKSIITVVFAGLSLGASWSAADEPLDFNRDVRPILSQNCFFCHGQDESHREAGLRLDIVEGAMANKEGKQAVVPGKVEKSELIARIGSLDPDVVMPPPSSHKKLTAPQKETLRKWIEQGARYDRHWAYITPARRSMPAQVEAIDFWVERRLQSEGLGFSPPAQPHAWLRRVSLDLTGLPPSRADSERFQADLRTQGEPAYAAAVDRLLASPRFGERMAQDWLDIARYADTHGFNNDSERTMWPWRDWVINAFNANLPYDQFLIEQLAGDLLPNPTLDQRIATGFCRNHVINSEGGIIDEEYRIEYVADRLRTVSMAWLGLTMECARCHSHKYDAITQRDYYSLFAFFNNVPEHGEDGRVANAAPLIAAPTKSQRQEIERLDAEIAELDKRLNRLRGAIPPAAPNLTGLAPADTAADWSIACDTTKPIDGLIAFPEGAPETVSGFLGQAWNSHAGRKCGEIAGSRIDVNQPMTLSLWIRPTKENPDDVALISSVDYGGTRSQQGYGHGHEVRLIHGEIEVRANDFFPAYAMRVGTRGARVMPDVWTHVAIVTGAEKQARDVRVFVNGSEAETKVTYDGVHNTRHLANGACVLGGERTKGAARFVGAIDELRFNKRKLTGDEIRRRYLNELVRSVQAHSPGSATANELAVLREFAFSLTNAEYRDVSTSRTVRWERRLETLRSSPTAMVMHELPKPRPTFVMQRGRYDAPGEPVSAAVPEQAIFPWPAELPRNRLGLAQWLVHPKHPLTARVVVNRFWAQLFGQGLVATVEDFGAQGEYPTHPELLDTLARDFTDGGWNTKALLRRMALSRTYRQSSRVTAEHLAKDADNRLLARTSRIRLPAEAMRDQALAVAGLLSEKVGGPSVRPYQPAGLYDGLVVGADYPGTKWETSTGADLFRRSLYTFWKRTVPHPVMSTFDVPDREVCTARRGRTNTPLQALVLLNEPAFVEASRRLARRIHEQPGAARDRLRWAFQLVLNRDVSQSELDQLLPLLPADSQTSASAWNSIATILLNLDETVTRE